MEDDFFTNYLPTAASTKPSSSYHLVDDIGMARTYNSLSVEKFFFTISETERHAQLSRKHKHLKILDLLKFNSDSEEQYEDWIDK